MSPAIVCVDEDGDAGAVLAGAADRQRRSVIGHVVGRGSCGAGSFFFNDTATTEIYTLSLHDALPIYVERGRAGAGIARNIGLDGADVMDAVAAERNVGAEDAAGDESARLASID